MKEILIKEGEYINFTIEFEEGQDFEYSATCKVYETISWVNDPPEVSEDEEYLSAYIKWDGCSHIHFKEEGYLHLCGKSYFESHIQVMNKVWELCTTKIKHFDKDLAE